MSRRFEERSMLRYIVWEVESIMGLAALKEEFEEVVAAFRPAPPLAQDAWPEAEDVREKFDQQMREARRKMLRWRSDMLGKVALLEELLERAASFGDDEIGFLLGEMQRVHEAVNSAIEDAERKLDLPPEAKAKMDFVVRLRPDAEKLARHMERKYHKAASERLGYLLDIRDRLKHIEWDHDPEARGGQTFRTADALIAFLRS